MSVASRGSNHHDSAVKVCENHARLRLNAFVLIYGVQTGCFSLLPTPKNATKRLDSESPVVAAVNETKSGDMTVAVAVSPSIETDEAHHGTGNERQTLALVDAGKKIPMQYTATGDKDYEALARVGHHESRVVQTSFTDLLPRDMSEEATRALLQRPSEEEVERQARATQDAFNQILAKNTTAGRIGTAASASFVKFTPQGEDESRIVKVMEMPKDPFDPPKFSHKRAPKPPPSPPPPVLHSPPRRVTAEEQRSWHIPPCISNWKNPKGYTIPLDKRLAADGRGLQENRINEGFASFAESLYLAERHARDEVEKRALVEKKLAERERAEQEGTLRSLAHKAREEKAAIAAQISHSRESEGRDSGHGRAPSPSRESKFGPLRVHGAEQNLSVAEREELRRQVARQQERDFRLSRMSEEQRARHLSRTEDRDVSERIALGQRVVESEKTREPAEGIFDQRLFDQSAGLDQGFRDDEAYNIYDKPLFAGSAVHLIYRPTLAGDDALDAEESGPQPAGEDTSGRTRRAGTAFQGAEATVGRAGPVEFERDETTEADPFGLDSFLSEAKQSSSAKRSAPVREDERKKR